MKMIVDRRLELPIENQSNTLRKIEDRHWKRSGFVFIDLKLEASFFKKKNQVSFLLLLKGSFPFIL